MKQITLIAILVLTSIIGIQAQERRAFESRSQQSIRSGNSILRESTNNRGESVSSPLRSGEVNPGGNEEMGEPLGGPIGDGTWILLALGAAYGVYCTRRKVAKNKL